VGYLCEGEDEEGGEQDVHLDCVVWRV
jgi:hypothetical protein